jgi:hypothetical protein
MFVIVIRFMITKLAGLFQPVCQVVANLAKIFFAGKSS